MPSKATSTSGSGRMRIMGACRGDAWRTCAPARAWRSMNARRTRPISRYGRAPRRGSRPGRARGAMAGRVDYLLRVPVDSTPRIQEAHLVIGHAICELAEEILAGRGVG